MPITGRPQTVSFLPSAAGSVRVTAAFEAAGDGTTLDYSGPAQFAKCFAEQASIVQYGVRQSVSGSRTAYSLTAEFQVSAGDLVVCGLYGGVDGGLSHAYFWNINITAEYSVAVDTAKTALSVTQAAAPVADYGTWYDTGGTGGPVWVMENFEAAISSPSVLQGSDINRVIFIDPVSGSDANAGTMAAPKRTHKPSAWSGSVTTLSAYDLALIKRGTTYIHDDSYHALDVHTNQHLGAYGDPTAPRPLVRSLNDASVEPYVIGLTSGPHCSVSDIDIDASDRTNRSGIVVSNAGIEADLFDITLANMDITGVTNSGTSLRAGVRFMNNGYNATRGTDYPLMYDINCINVDVHDVGYHGFHSTGAIGKYIDGAWHSIRFQGCKAIRCSSQWAGHGFSAFAYGTVRDMLLLYTYVSGTTYYLNTGDVWGYVVPNVEIVYQRTTTGGISYYFLRKNITTPSTPAVGEFGFDVFYQRIYINCGVPLPSATGGAMATGSNTDHNFDSCTHTVNGMVYDRCMATSTIDRFDLTGVHEGHGIAFDDLTSNTTIINCDLHDNEGMGVSFNRGYGNRVFNSRLVDNAGGVMGGIGVGHRIWGNYAVGSGLLSNYQGNALISWSVPLYLFKDAQIICGGFRRLAYTGSDTSAFLMSGPSNFVTHAPAFDMSSIEPGRGKIAGYGSGAGEGGFVLSRGLLLPDQAHRSAVSPNFKGFI